MPGTCASALDYGAIGITPALGHNIQADNITTQLANLNTVVDMMIGRPGPLPTTENFGNANFEHPFVRNDEILNLTGVANPEPEFPNTYHSCIGSSNETERGMLNMEIGDEELYLENAQLRWNAEYQAEFDIHVNDRNPRYVYPSQPLVPNSPMLDGVYSREAPFIVAGNGSAVFIYDQTHSPTGIGINISNPLPASFQQINQELFICCTNFLDSRASFLGEPEIKIPKDESYIKLFPNPNTGSQITLKYQLKSKGNVTVSIYSINGKRVLFRHLPIADATVATTTQLPLPILSAGIYLLRLTNGREIKRVKFIVSK